MHDFSISRQSFCFCRCLYLNDCEGGGKLPAVKSKHEAFDENTFTCCVFASWVRLQYQESNPMQILRYALSSISNHRCKCFQIGRFLDDFKQCFLKR